MSLGLFHEVLSTFRADGMDCTTGLYITPAAIRTGLTLEGKTLGVTNVLEFQVVIVLQAIGCSPGGTKVVAVVLI